MDVRLFSLLALAVVSVDVSAAYVYSFGCPPSANRYGSDDAKCTLVVSGFDETTCVDISLSTNTSSVCLTPGDIHEVELADSFRAVNGTTDKVVRVDSDTKIHVVMKYLWSVRLYETTQVDHFPLDDTQSQYEYVMVGNDGGFAHRDTTDQFYTLTTLETANIEIYRNGSLLEVAILNPNEVHNFVITYHPNYNGFDMTGTVVKSDRPLSVLCGSVYTSVGIQGSTPYITSVSMQPSTKFVVPNLSNRRNTGYNVKVIALSDSTTVTAAEDVFELNQYEHAQFEYPGKDLITVVECDKDCMAYIFIANSLLFDQGSLLSTIPVTDMYDSAYFITLEFRDIDCYFINIVTEGAAPYDFITMDGESLENEDWSSLFGYGYVVVQVTTEGGHWLTSSGPKFAAYTYANLCEGESNGYGYTILPDYELSSDISMTNPTYSTSTRATVVAPGAAAVTSPSALPWILVVAVGLILDITLN